MVPCILHTPLTWMHTRMHGIHAFDLDAHTPSNDHLFAQNFGSKDHTIEAEAAACKEVLDAFVAKGGNFIDTADVYHGGRSEEVSVVPCTHARAHTHTHTRARTHTHTHAHTRAHTHAHTHTHTHAHTHNTPATHSPLARTACGDAARR
jgi:hypothetical protein